MHYSAHLRLPFPPAAIREVLADIGNYPTWWPAFSAMDPPEHHATIDGVYRARVRQLVRVRVHFERLEDTGVGYVIATTEHAERGHWELSATPEGDATDVHHHFTHVGTLLLLMKETFRTVGDQRLERLKKRLEAIADGTAEDAVNTPAPRDCD